MTKRRRIGKTSLILKTYEDEQDFQEQDVTSIWLTNTIHSHQAFYTSVLKELLATYHPNYTPEELLTLYTFTGRVVNYVQLMIDNGATTKDYLWRTCSHYSGGVEFGTGRQNSGLYGIILYHFSEKNKKRDNTLAFIQNLC